MGDPTKLFHIVGLISALALGVGFVTGLVSVGLSWRINEQQRHELEKLRADVATQQERAAKAELALEEVRKKQEPRHINRDAFDAFLKGKRKATAVIQYHKNDPEAYNFAMNLWFALHDEAGWDIQFLPSPIEDSVDPYFSQLPSVLAAGGINGVTILTKEIKPFPTTREASPYAALVKVLRASGVEASAAIDVRLPDDSFRIIVGAKP